MSVAFSPLPLGSMTLRNRFVRSATWEGCVDKDGSPTPRLFKMIRRLAEGHVGLIVSGYYSVSKAGMMFQKHTVMQDPAMADTWRPTLAECHKLGSKVIFQIGHGGVFCLDGVCRGPSVRFLAKTEMTNADIEDVIDDFTKTSVNLFKAGADGVQLHGAHGFMLACFLSPLMNRRKDKWGGSEEGRVKIVAEIAESIRRATDPSFAISIKMNGHDHWPFGVNPGMCGRYVNMLKGKIDMFEISYGLFTPHSIRGITLNPTLLQSLSDKVNPWRFTTMYSQKHAAYVKKMNPWATIATVGGVRNIGEANAALISGDVDLVSLSRPLIREPNLIRAWEEGKKPGVTARAATIARRRPSQQNTALYVNIHNSALHFL